MFLAPLAVLIVCLRKVRPIFVKLGLKMSGGVLTHHHQLVERMKLVCKILIVFRGFCYPVDIIRSCDVAELE
jgi:hypothetical protein